ncbi:ROK family protein [Paenibacillus sp. GP183]|uniref:ROK family protein n=1 Tax=Paenibacillus sp. GP183 TaxID=1882751 RepID=UPI0008969442|nr:ROK family protein [Paenibacillus sp. GP183]SEB53686.1 glucokinase [Paenibacillus sp. GP183]
MRIIVAGIDIGGTKCAVSLGKLGKPGERIELLGKKRFPTPSSPQTTISLFMAGLDELLEQHQVTLSAIGISCGGPLSSKSGLILSPPNLPGWDCIDIVSPFRERYGVPTGLQNDANACALAEWKWGAGVGCSHMIFLTFGTGMGAGLILNDRLYAGTNDMAGEVGHIRLAENGPIGFGKAGSFEGYCSGGGIARLAQKMAASRLQAGEASLFCSSEAELGAITAQQVGEAAGQGDPLAVEIFLIVGTQLGRGLALLVDTLNPQRIVIGSIYGRQQQILEPIVMKELSREALSISLQVCEIVPAGLGEQVGDYASLSVALFQLDN